MGERFLAIGNEAVGWGAFHADCKAFFGYPITPQNEVAEWFALKFPPEGRVFFQAPSETSAINLLFGAGACGVRAMTSTSSPGWSLMQETMSHLSNAELPCVIVLVQRGGPGQGTTRHGQMDYLSVTKGGGHGGYKNIVLAPASVQETHDLMQLAFHLADKYRNPAIVLSDAVIGLTMEWLEPRSLEFEPLPEKDWAIRGRDRQKDRKKRLVGCSQGLTPWPPHFNYLSLLEGLDRKHKLMQAQEVRYESDDDDAEVVVVAYGYTAQASKRAVELARQQGVKAGWFRPITLYPFPYDALNQRARRGCRFLVVEDSLGQMVEDVRLGVEGQAPIHFLGALARHTAQEMGLIFPERIEEEIRRIAQ